MSLLHYENKACLKSIFPEYVAERDDNGLMISDYIPFSAEYFPSSIYFQTT